MNKYQEALDYIESVLKDEDVLRIFDSPNYLEYINKHLFNIKELADKATPQKIKPFTNSFFIKICPNCGSTLETKRNYCDECGQKLDWS